MVAQRIKSLIIEKLAKRSDHRAFPILYDSLPCLYVPCLCSGHKLENWLFDWKEASPWKLLKIRRRLVAGAGSNCRPWGYESQRSVRTSFILRKKPIKQWVAVGKDAFMSLMRPKVSNESRQNLGKIIRRVRSPINPSSLNPSSLRI